MDTREIERKIAEKIIDDALAAGNTIDVWDGEEYPLKSSTDKDAILDAMFSTDADHLYLTKGNRRGWVYLVYGNGCDVISDYTLNIENTLDGARSLSDRLEKEHG
jgi:hypothetical protein